MSTTKYASAVAAVKAMEGTLLTRNDMEQLIGASGQSEFSALLTAKKGTSADESAETVWSMIKSYAPKSRELEILLYKNDFHNLKAALKSMISGREANQYYIRPTNLDLNHLSEILAEKSYENLPVHIRKTAQEAYELLVRTSDGQLSDSFIDAETLRTIQKDSEEYGGDFMQSYALLTVVYADIKTAYRCSRMKKQRAFLENAICGSKELEKDALVTAALEGTESLMTMLESSGYSEIAGLLNESAAQFEKRCDDVIMELAQTARMKSFGSEPLAAYYLAAEAEQKNLRIISVCREFGADRETINERMRMLYV